VSVGSVSPLVMPHLVYIKGSPSLLWVWFPILNQSILCNAPSAVFQIKSRRRRPIDPPRQLHRALTPAPVHTSIDKNPHRIQWGVMCPSPTPTSLASKSSTQDIHAPELALCTSPWRGYWENRRNMAGRTLGAQATVYLQTSPPRAVANVATRLVHASVG
jgi:hypothetical protein